MTYLLLCLAWACGSNGRLVGQRYVRDGISFRIGALPPEWSRVDAGPDSDLAFARPDRAAVIQVNAACKPSLDIPLQALTKHLLIGFTERKVLSQERRPMSRREALVSHVRAKLDGVERELLLVVLKKNGCVYDFGLIAPPGTPFRSAQADYEQFLNGFEAPVP